jgi:hypothetical protein
MKNKPIIIMFQDLKDAIENIPKCKGHVFKAHVSSYSTRRGVYFKTSLIKMKKLSCKGCEHCDWINDVFDEINNDWPLIGIENVINGGLYRIVACNESKDWESGMVDSYDLKLEEYKQ